jgi:outer membrane protein assembly factor BamD
MAANEIHVAHYYYKRGAYLAAANRGKYVIEHYQQAPAMEQALVVMAKSYDKLGLNDLRDDTLKVLKHNFPNSPLYAGDVLIQDKSAWKFW